MIFLGGIGIGIALWLASVLLLRWADRHYKPEACAARVKRHNDRRARRMARRSARRAGAEAARGFRVHPHAPTTDYRPDPTTEED